MSYSPQDALGQSSAPAPAALLPWCLMCAARKTSPPSGPLLATLRTLCTLCSWVEDACNEASQADVLEAALRLLRAMPFQAAVLEQSGGWMGGWVWKGAGIVRRVPLRAPMLALRCGVM